MMLTALEIMQRMRQRINIQALTSLESQGDPDELQLIELLVVVCEELRETKAFPTSKRTYSFDTVSGTDAYKLPIDFYSPLLGTHFNQDEFLRLTGPVSDDTFNYLLYGSVSGTTNYTYRLFGMDQNPASVGGQFKLYPEPSAAQTISFEYISRHLFLPPHWVANTSYTTSPLSRVNINGNIYKCTVAGTSGSTGPTGTAASGITDGTAEWGYVNEPYERPITDTDLCIFDHSLVKTGLRAKWLEEKGGDWQNAAADYEKAKMAAKARMKGSYIGTFARNGVDVRYRVPYRNWSI